VDVSSMAFFIYSGHRVSKGFHVSLRLHNWLINSLAHSHTQVRSIEQYHYEQRISQLAN
jgi:hypothetical protein